MSYFENFLKANQAYVDLHGDLHLPIKPKTQVAIVTCMEYNAQLQRGKPLWQELLLDVMCNYNIVVKLIQKKIQFLLQKSTAQVKP